MFVFNDVTLDSRVLREATSLARAGHQVTVIGTTRPDEASGSREERDGFTIIRVALFRRWPLWYVWLQHPWRLRGRLGHLVVAGVKAGPAGIGRALVALGAAIVSLPWLVVRGAWHAIVHELPRRPVQRNWLNYVLWWRSFVLGWDRAAAAVAPGAEIYHANDMDTLPAALAAARRDHGRVVYDCHEIFLEWGEHVQQPGWLRAIVRRWERTMAQQAAAVVTVNDACAAVLEGRLHPRRIVVVHNCPPRWTPPVIATDRLRHAAGIPAEAPILLSHGAFQLNRGLEQTVAALAMPGLEGAHLVFLGYRTKILEPILAASPNQARIHVLPAVPPDELLGWVAGADVGLVVIQPTDLNKIVSSPNKLFESLAAGVPVVASDFPVMRGIVIDDPAGPLGAVCDPTDPARIAAAIRSMIELSPEARSDLRRRCLGAAHERWNWETESARLVELYASLATESASG